MPKTLGPYDTDDVRVYFESYYDENNIDTLMDTFGESTNNITKETLKEKRDEYIENIIQKIKSTDTFETMLANALNNAKWADPYDIFCATIQDFIDIIDNTEQTTYLNKYENNITSQTCPTCKHPLKHFITTIDAQNPDWITRETTCNNCGANIKFHYSLTECELTSRPKHSNTIYGYIICGNKSEFNITTSHDTITRQSQEYIFTNKNEMLNAAYEEYLEIFSEFDFDNPNIDANDNRLMTKSEFNNTYPNTIRITSYWSYVNIEFFKKTL